MVGDKQYEVIHGDCIEGMATLPPACMDLAIFSPPFFSMYSYQSDERDLGNSEDVHGDAQLHLSFFYRQLARVVKPGRVIMVHVANIPRMKRVDKRGGLIDFQGMNIRLGERAGLTWEYSWTVRKNPQAQALRSKSRELQFAGLEADRAKSRGCLPDYLLKFRTQGENAVPICDSVEEADESSEDFAVHQAHDVQVTRNNWIDWAECTWNDIRDTDTLNGQKGKEEARGVDDVKHIAPLQLGVIHRLVRLFSNPGELVFSPFAGIGSEGYEALKLGRRFFGFELKKEYFDAALRNLARAARLKNEEQSMNLFAETMAANEAPHGTQDTRCGRHATGIGVHWVTGGACDQADQP